MPAYTENKVTGYAFCTSAVCPGYKTEPVDALERETSWMFTENGGDIPGVERSHKEWVFANEADIPCESCGNPRSISPTDRPSYDPLSGHSPDFLISGPKFDPNKVNTEADERQAAEMAEMRKQIAELTKAMQDKRKAA